MFTGDRDEWTLFTLCMNLLGDKFNIAGHKNRGWSLKFNAPGT